MTPEADAPYTLRRIEEMLGLSRSVVAGLIGAGFVVPSRGPRNEYRFSFQDVVLLRTAYQLRAARIPPRRMLRSLKELKARLPQAMPLSGLRIKAIGHDIAVRAADAQWEAETGQLLMDFEVAAADGSVSFLQRTPPVDPVPSDLKEASEAVDSASALPPLTAKEWFALGERLEEGDDRGACERAYLNALALDPAHANAAVNLGAMLCEAGRCSDAMALYREAIRLSPDVPLLHFNLAIALEDQHLERDALASYEQSLALAPDLGDAHYNAARLFEKIGDPHRALRHYAAYRRIEQRQLRE